MVGEASVLYSALVEKQAAQQRAKRNAALAAEHAYYRDGKAATCRQPKPDGELAGDRLGDPHASTPDTNRLQLFVDRSLHGVWFTNHQTNKMGNIDNSAWTWIDETGRHWRVDDFESIPRGRALCASYSTARRICGSCITKLSGGISACPVTIGISWSREFRPNRASKLAAVDVRTETALQVRPFRILMVWT